GDVILSPAYIRRQADELGETFEDEIALMVVHGALHRLGYEHDSAEEAEVMAKREAEILHSVGRRRRRTWSVLCSLWLPCSSRPGSAPPAPPSARYLAPTPITTPPRAREEHVLSPVCSTTGPAYRRRSASSAVSSSSLPRCWRWRRWRERCRRSRWCRSSWWWSSSATSCPDSWASPSLAPSPTARLRC